MVGTIVRTFGSVVRQHPFITIVCAVCSLPLVMLAIILSLSIIDHLEPDIRPGGIPGSVPPAADPGSVPSGYEIPRIYGGIPAPASPQQQQVPQQQQAQQDEVREPVRTPDECLAHGIINPDGCLDYVAIFERLKEAPLAYNRPDRMVFERATELSLVIDHSESADPVGALGDLEGSIVEGTTRVSLRMSAQLHGSAFTVEPEGLQRKLVTPVAPTRWTWSVTPREFGSDKLLTLEVYAHIQDGDNVLEPLQIRTYTDRIFVDVTTWDYVRRIVRDLAPVHAFVVALFGTLSGIAAWAWRQSRRRSEQAAVAEAVAGGNPGTNRVASEEPESGPRSG